MRSILFALMLALSFTLIHAAPGSAGSASESETCIPDPIPGNGWEIAPLQVCTYEYVLGDQIYRETCLKAASITAQEDAMQPAYVCFVESHDADTSSYGICFGWEELDLDGGGGIHECHLEDTEDVEDVLDLVYPIVDTSVGSCTDPAHEICYRIQDPHYGPECTGIELRYPYLSAVFLICQSEYEDSYQSSSNSWYQDHECISIYSSARPGTGSPLISLCEIKQGSYTEPPTTDETMYFDSTCYEAYFEDFAEPNLVSGYAGSCIIERGDDTNIWYCSGSWVQFIQIEACMLESDGTVCYTIDVELHGASNC